jgi:hypothetical protein
MLRAAQSLPLCSEAPVHLADLDGTECALYSEVVQASFKEQSLFFKDLDRATVTPHDVAMAERFEDDLGQKLEKATATGWMTPMLSDFNAATTSHPSETIVMEAAFYLIASTLLRIPGTKYVNVKQAIALLQYARWIQCCKTKEWQDQGQLLPATDQTSLAFQLRLVLIGAAGTGKSTVLRMVEALADKFFGPMSMRKGAPSNAAARLIGGDTIHALLTLPLFGDLYGKQGHLTDPVKRTLRRKWKNARPTYLGELRM